MKSLLFVLANVALILGEPPVPSNVYLPGAQTPSDAYGAPSGGLGGAIPSSSYGTPVFGGAKPGIQYGPPSTQYGAPGSGGFSGVVTPSTKYGAPGAGGRGGFGGTGGYDYPSEPANYHFKYDVQDAPSGNDFGHEEERHGDDTRGKYYVLLPDGRRQTVEYTADVQGYHPKVSYEQVTSGFGGGRGGIGGYPGGAGGYQGGAGGYQY